MRHLKAGKRLGVTTSHRKAMMRNLVTALLEHGEIRTTITRAKEMRKYCDRMIGLGKRQDLHARRQALSFIKSKEIVQKLFEEYGPLYENRNGGYTRIYRLGRRLGDNAQMALIQLVDLKEEEEKPARKKAAPEAISEIKSELQKDSAPEETAEGEEGTETVKAEAETESAAAAGEPLEQEAGAAEEAVAEAAAETEAAQAPPETIEAAEETTEAAEEASSEEAPAEATEAAEEALSEEAPAEEPTLEPDKKDKNE